MTCQKSIKEDIVENYETGDYEIREVNEIDEYQKFLDSPNTILPYYWGVWVTSYGMDNKNGLFALAKCIRDSNKDDADRGIWLYSDTDSCYCCGWDEEKLAAFNQRQKDRLMAAGYGPVIKGGREYWPGVVELDGEYWEFVGLHSKCYSARTLIRGPKGENSFVARGDLKITIAGVPKKNGAKCLRDDINLFKDGFIFPGKETGKLTHYYIYRKEPVVENGIEKGNSVDLHYCDYEIKTPSYKDILNMLENEEQEMQVYDEE